MKSRNRFIETRREDCWQRGVLHREELVREFMARNNPRERPLLKDIIDELIGEVQMARLRYGVLPLDTFAQTEVVDGRAEVTINSRIKDMPRVKDAAGVAYQSKWHESIHVADMLHEDAIGGAPQKPLPGFGAEMPRRIACRRGKTPLGPLAATEFTAENAGRAAAIAGADLARSIAFRELQDLAGVGGDLGKYGWKLLYDTAKFIGVNGSAFETYLEQRGFLRIEMSAGQSHLAAAPQLFGGGRWGSID